MDIEYFVARRKARGYSQVELSRGICTQSTLSKFENNSQIPSLVILRQLCERLDLTLDDLDERSRATFSLRHQLEMAEEELMVENYRAAQKILGPIKIDQIKNTQLKMQYHYLEGLMATLTNQADTVALFSFTQILDELDERHETVFSQLAYLGEGILYARKNLMERAEFFINKVKQYLTVELKRGDPYPGNVDNARLLTMMYYLGEYYTLLNQPEESNHYLKRGIDRCAHEHVTYFLPRLKLLRVQNALAVGEDPQLVLEELTDARAFARLNQNNAVLIQVTALIKRYRDLLTKTAKGEKDDIN